MSATASDHRSSHLFTCAAPPTGAIPTHTFPSNYQNHDHHLLAALCAWNRAHGENKSAGELKLMELSEVLRDAAVRRRDEQFAQAIEILSAVPDRWARWRATWRWFFREVICGE
jgi:hypothetical protein